MNQLICSTLKQNLTLREAGQRIEEVSARRGVMAGNLFPQSQASTGAFSKSRLSSNTANFVSFPGVFEPNLNPENWSLGFAASWELDFWGRYQASVLNAQRDAEDVQIAFVYGFERAASLAVAANGCKPSGTNC